MTGIGFGLLMVALASSPCAVGDFCLDTSSGEAYAGVYGESVSVVVKWEDVLTRVLVDLHGNVYNIRVREVVEAAPGEFCRVELVLRHDKAMRLGLVGADLLKVTCPR